MPSPEMPLARNMTKTVVYAEWLACHDCDALHRDQQLLVGQSALCHRCGAVLYRSRSAGVDRPLAFALTGLLFFAIANFYPLLSLELGGLTQESTLFAGVTALFAYGLWPLALLVFCTTLLFPLLSLLSMIYLLLPLYLRRRPWWRSAWVYRVWLAMTPWEMTSVYALGVMVATIKLRDLATVLPGVALYAFAGLLLAAVAAGSTFDPHAFWRSGGATT